MTETIPTEQTETNGSNVSSDGKIAADNSKKIPSAEDSVPPASKYSPKDVSLKSSASTLFNVEVDSLTQKLERVTIKDLAPMESRSVRVPPGYRLALQIGPAGFYKLRDEVKKNNKRKREQGLLSKSSRAKVFYGFRPEEVLWNGASLKDCKPSNLSNDIHPLLHHSRFDDCPDTIYDELRPGLRLATMFLTQPICSQFWLTLANGERKTDLKHSWLTGVKCQRIEKNVPMTKENTANVIEYIRQLDKANMIHWSFQHDLVVCDTTVYGATKWVCDNHHELPRGPENTLVPQHIRIHADMYTVASKFSKLEYADTAQKLRFSFFVAVIICHELAHAVEGAHRRGRPLGVDLHIEPRLFDDDIAEMGRAWESITLGGTVHPINAAVDCSHGIGTWDWPDVDPEVDWERNLKYTVPMSYIENLFQMETWQREYNLENWKAFHIPRDGAISVNLNNLTTMPWSEEARVAREELEESLNAADPDEPAAKKREIAMGQAVISSAKFGEKLESSEEGAKAALLMQATEQQERIIRTPTTMSRKQRRKQKRAERNATDDKCAVSKKDDEEGSEQATEDVKVTMDPENQTKKNTKGKEKAVQEVVNVEKDRAVLQAAEETEVAMVPGKQKSMAQQHSVTSKEQSPAEVPTSATEPLAEPKQAPPAESPVATQPPPFMSKTVSSPAEEQAVILPTEPAPSSRSATKTGLLHQPATLHQTGAKPHDAMTTK